MRRHDAIASRSPAAGRRPRGLGGAVQRLHPLLRGARCPTTSSPLTWQRLLAQQDGLLGLVAVDDERSPDRPGARALPPLDVVADDLLLSGGPLRRSRPRAGTGWGALLIEAVYREADKRGATRTYWATKEDNRHRAAPLRPGGHLEPVRAVPAVSCCLSSSSLSSSDLFRGSISPVSRC